ncbi:MAG: hybrid sensor histidine kinase/response regulator [Polyangiaceae bacterium]
MARILHIEDDPTNRLLVRKLLAAHGYDVIDAADGLEGVKSAMAQRPDLVLVDINIPKLDGYEVTLRLRGEPSLQGVPIVAITAEGNRETSLAMGCDGFLQKPIDARSFAKNIARYLGGKRESTPPEASEERLRQQSQRIVARLEEKVTELSVANERLREAERARTAFYRNMSHELATPMTPIVGYLKLLQDGELGPVSKGQAKALGSMDDCVRRLRSLIDNLLDVTAVETGKMRFFPRDYDVSDVVRKVVTQLAPQLAQHCVVQELPARCAGFGDPERLTRALGLLLDNAIKFTPEGGTIGLSVRTAGDRVEIVVADSGPGVRADVASRIFDAFFQGDASVTREHGGVGVGLAIVDQIARGFRGQVILLRSPVSVAGAALNGAAFALDLPLRAPMDTGQG